MGSELVINVTPLETRVALLENGILVEIYIEREKDRGIAGNIYKGKVVRILPGMQVAFVDIGLNKSAFLYVDDVFYDFKDIETEMLRQNDDEEESSYGQLEEERSSPAKQVFQINDLLIEGQELLVQVSKGRIGSKGPRITSHISLPGRYLVFLPNVNHVGISRRIENEKERKRLKEIVQKTKPQEMGFIVRTASEDMGEDDIKLDSDYLVKLWENIQKKQANSPTPSLIHRDLNLTLKEIRDLSSKDIDSIVVDSKEEYNNILKFTEMFMPQLSHLVTLYERDDPIFDYYGIEIEINRAFGERVWLKSGGYIVIERTEAVTTIDVNTGRYVGKGNPEDTILRTNLEAVKEIAYQLRLRDIGGIIIIDFIDMKKEESREKVFKTLKEVLSKDKSRTNILRISELGLVEMTRKRTSEDLIGYLSEPCFYCDGKGFLKSKETICHEIFRSIKKEASKIPGNKIFVALHPEVADLIYEEERNYLEDLENHINKKIIIKVKENLHIEQFEIN
ncbi:MAG: Rne/Rng family ribonuclease [Thermodesulfobacteriota bacterium]|jgi:ribonuclease G|nr:MAG: Rne/Rng family ribonuclease [Thermodesulfobacteriota bacterium]